MKKEKRNKRKGLSKKAGEYFTGWLFVSPMLIGFSIFMFGPLIYAFYMSLHDWPLLGETSFIGLENYKKLSTDKTFQNSIKVTFMFSLGLVPFNIVLAIILALLLKDRFPGIGFFRTAIFVPVVTSLIVWAIVWEHLLAPELGFVNQFLSYFGIKGPAWLLNKTTALPAVIFVSVIKNVGLNMILFLTAMQQVPTELYEAARLDGAKSFRKFFNITLPLITPTIFLTMIITMIGAMKVFGQVYVMTSGGPGESTKVLVYYIWEMAFRLFDIGYASSIAFILFFILLAFTVFSWILRRKWVFYES